MISDKSQKIKSLKFLIGIFFLLNIGAQLILAPDSYGGSKAKIVTKKGKELLLEFDYAMVTTVEKGKTLKKEAISEKDTFIMTEGGSHQFIHQDQIPFGVRFGFFWYVPVTDRSDSFDLTVEFTSPIKKTKQNKNGFETKSFKSSIEVLKGVGHFFIETTEGDLPGDYTLKLFYEGQPLISKKFKVLEP